MPIILNQAGYDHALSLIKNGLEVEHDVNNWDEVKPTKDEHLKYLDTHSLDEYGLWFLGINTELEKDIPSKFVYPFGDFSVLHKSALITAEQQAAQKHDHEIKSAAQKLLSLIK